MSTLVYSVALHFDNGTEKNLNYLRVSQQKLYWFNNSKSEHCI
jgi:hypothetical protein